MTLSNASLQFRSTLGRMRAIDRFAVGRRILSLVALRLLAPTAEQIWSGIFPLPAAGRDERRDLLISRLAEGLEKESPSLRGVFSSSLVPDALHSRSFSETMYLATAIAQELAVTTRKEFGVWFDSEVEYLAGSTPTAGELSTSPGISKLLVDVAAGFRPTTFYDPCCGLGSLLSAAHRLHPSANLIGCEQHPVSWAISMLRLHLLDAEADIRLTDALLTPPPTLGQGAVVLCDPPFGPYVYSSGMPGISHGSTTGMRSSRIEALFVDHCAKALAGPARAAILVNPSFLTRRGQEERLRSSLAKQGRIVAIIYLPQGISAWTYSELTILVLGSPTANRNSIKIIDASRQSVSRQDRIEFQHSVRSIIADALQPEARPSEIMTEIDIDRFVAGGSFRPNQYSTTTPNSRPIGELLRQANDHERQAREQLDAIRELFDQLGTGSSD